MLAAGDGMGVVRSTIYVLALLSSPEAALVLKPACAQGGASTIGARTSARDIILVVLGISCRGY